MDRFRAAPTLAKRPSARVWRSSWASRSGDDVIVSNNKTEDEFTLKIVGIVEQRKSVPRESFMIGLPPSRGAASDARTGSRRSLCALDAGREAGRNSGEDRLCRRCPHQRHQDRANFAPTGPTSLPMHLRRRKSKPRRTWGPNSIRVRLRKRSAGRPYRLPAFRSWRRCSSFSPRSIWAWTSASASSPCCAPFRSRKCKSAP